MNKLEKTYNYLVKAVNKTIAGIVWEMLADDHLEGEYVIINSSPNKIRVKESSQGKGSLEDILSKIKSDIPIILLIKGKGIIQKSIPFDSGSDPFNMLFPNIRESEFYSQIDEKDNQKILSIIRKEKITQIIKQIRLKGNSVLSVRLGNADYCANEDKGSILLSLESNGFDLSDDLMNLTYSTWSFINSDFLSPPKDEILRTNYREFLVKSGFKTVSSLLIVTLFAALLINFFRYQNLQKEISLFEIHSLNNNAEAQKQLELERLEKIKESISLFDIDYPGHLAYFADQIALSLPNELSLTSLKIFPITDDSQKDESIVYNSDIISINGSTTSSAILEKWISGLPGIGQILSVELSDYHLNSYTRLGEFSLLIHLRK